MRLFSKKKFPQERVPPSIFWSFATEWMLKNLKRPSLSVFSGIVGLFSKKNHKSVPNSPILGNLKSFCYFWALDMAPTWAVPGLFRFCNAWILGKTQKCAMFDSGQRRPFVLFFNLNNNYYCSNSAVFLYTASNDKITKQETLKALVPLHLLFSHLY